MKSLVLEKYNEFIIRETEIPELKPGLVLIKVEACGICGSNVHGMDGSTGRSQPPVIMRHEASGIIHKVSPEVRFPLQKVLTRQLKIQGSCASDGEYPLCLELIASGRINVDSLISKVAPPEEGNEWFHRLYSKENSLMNVILKL